MQTKSSLGQAIKTTCGLFLTIFLVMSGAKLFMLFLPEFEKMGMSMGAVALASVIGTTSILVAGTNIDKIMKAMGMKRMMLLGAVLMAAAYFLFALASNVAILLLAFILMGTATSLCGYTPASIIITNWFSKGRGLALSVVFTGMSLGTALYSYLSGIMLTQYGLRTTCMLIGAGMLILAVLTIALLVTPSPEEKGLHPYGYGAEAESRDKKAVGHRLIDIPAKEARKTSIFVRIMVVTILASGLVSTIQGYIPAHIQNEGLSLLQSSTVYSVQMLVGAIGTIIGGMIADRRGTRTFLLYTSLVLFAGTWLLILFPANYGLMLLMSGLMGIAYPLCSITPSLLMAETFGDEAYKGLLGIAQASTFASIGAMFPIVGFVFDRTGSYTTSMLAMNLLVVVLIVVSVSATSAKAKEKYFIKREAHYEP